MLPWQRTLAASVGQQARLRLLGLARPRHRSPVAPVSPSRLWHDGAVADGACWGQPDHADVAGPPRQRPLKMVQGDAPDSACSASRTVPP